MLRRVLALVLALFPVAAAAQSEATKLERALDSVVHAVQRSFARALPLPAPSAGVSYSFDAATGTFQRDPSTFGQIYLERADPLGSGRLNVSLVYQYVSLEALEGHGVNPLRTAAPIPVTDRYAAVDLASLAIDAEVHQFLFAASYGIGDQAEVSIAVPLTYSHISINAPITGAALTEEGELVLIEEQVRDDDNPVGIGDILLRGKYRFLEQEDFDLAAGLLLRLPVGSEDDLQGIGYLEVSPALLASTRVFRLAPWARLQGHVNAAIDFDTEDVDASDARWGLGLDWGMTDRITASMAFLAQNQFARVAPAGTFTFPRCNADVVTCALDPSVRGGTQQLYGLSGDRPDYYTFSIGGRGALWRDTLFLLANVAIPLNDGFVRTAPIPLVGLEATF